MNRYNKKSDSVSATVSATSTSTSKTTLQPVKRKSAKGLSGKDSGVPQARKRKSKDGSNNNETDEQNDDIPPPPGTQGCGCIIS